MPITTKERRERFNPGEVLGRKREGSSFIEGVERAIEAVAELFGKEIVIFSQEEERAVDKEKKLEE
ncbi:MAG: hypothetical protein ABIH88_02190 [Patescibacteria group bacterium]